ncbi:MAG: UTP--glucose-1-phosphate uridylyltransferase [bacterium]
MTIHAQSQSEREIIQRVHEAGQEHVFRFLNELSSASRRQLFDQLESIDWQMLSQLYRDFIHSPGSHSISGELEPAEVIPIPNSKEQMQAAHAAKLTGEAGLRQGRVAAFLVAGGQGTRLGFSGPKGLFPVSPVKQKSLFQLHAEKIKAASRRYGTTIPWYIMTSETNHEETANFFATHEFFGLNAEDIIFFSQDMVPALDPRGKLILDAKDHIFTNPNGHGGSLLSLKKSGALQDMRRRGIDLIFYFQVDNVLVKMCDPVFLGYHIRQGAQMSAKVVSKTDPQEKVGVVGRIDGRLGVIEYSDLSDAEKQARNPDGSLKFAAGNIAIHVLDVAFVEQENQGGLRLPWHVAHKKVPYLDEHGHRIEPEEPNGYKFEAFVFDALGDAESAVILEVKREEEFSPVKNARGVDSPETARQDMSNLFGTWLEKAGVAVPRDAENNVVGNVEVSPLFALDEEEFLQKTTSGLRFTENLYLEYT